MKQVCKEVKKGPRLTPSRGGRDDGWGRSCETDQELSRVLPRVVRNLPFFLLSRVSHLPLSPPVQVG